MADLKTLYEDYWLHERPDFEQEIEQSLNPRGLDTLPDLFSDTGIQAEDLILDVGCREAAFAVKFVQKHGCRAIAVDPFPAHLVSAYKTVEAAGVSERLEIRQGWIESLPLEDGIIDAIWCRDMLNHVDHQQGLRECWRVLKPGGKMLAYQAFAGESMERNEATRLYTALAIRPENMTVESFEKTVRRIGFETIHRERIGSEWRERGIEEGWGSVDPLILRLSRMRRREEELVEKYGRGFYEASYNGSLWLIFLALGKLVPYIHLLRKPG